MTAHPPFRKVLDGVATREQMFQLFNHHKDNSDLDPLSGTPYSGEWFEIEAAQYHFMLGLLPPLFQRTGMFGMSEFKAGNVTSVFLAIRIRGRERWFHGFCDLMDRQSPDKMRAAIIAHETGATDSMTREEKLEAIWNATHPDFKGIAGEIDPGAWPVEHHGKRAVWVDRGRHRTILKLLEDLSDDEIDNRMSAIRARTKRTPRKQPPLADERTYEAHSTYTAGVGVADHFRQSAHAARGANRCRSRGDDNALDARSAARAGST